MLWKKHLIEDDTTILKEISIGDFKIQAGLEEYIFHIMSSEIPGFRNVNIIEVLIDHNFPSREKTKILLVINISKLYQIYNRFLKELKNTRL